MMQADDPAFLPVGTDVSAKYKGAFCEAKIKKVVRNIKCKVTFKDPAVKSSVVSDDAIKGALRVGNSVEVKVDQRHLEATIAKIHDYSQYTVVFDDGDITTLRRTALCLKSGRHFAESETLDQLPLTHPEHFGNPVVCSTRRGRRTNRTQSDDSDSEASEWAGGSGAAAVGPGTPAAEREPHVGRVVLVQCSTGDKKRAHHQHQWFPGLVVAPTAQDTVKIKVKEDYLVRSFKDGRYYTVPKKEAREFRRNNTSTEWSGLEAAILYLDKGNLPTHWDRDILFGQDSQSQSDDCCSDDSMDDEPHEEKDHFVAQLYKFMDDSGTPLNRQPTIANRDLDLYRLFNLVQKLGGYNKVTSKNQWKRIAVRLGFQPATANVNNLCRQAYNKFLLSFEDFYRKLGVTLLSTPRGARTTGRSLIRDRDKMHSTPKSASPAPVATVSEEKMVETNSKLNSKVKEEKSVKSKEKESKLKEEPKEKEVKNIKDKEREKEIKEKENKEKENKEKEAKEKELKEKELKEKELKEKEAKEKDAKRESKSKDNKEKSKESGKAKSKETKVKSEPIVSSEEDSGDNQPLVPISIKTEKIDEVEKVTDKPSEKVKTPDISTKPPKLFKSASAIIDGKKSDRTSAKKIAHRRNSLPRIPSASKGDHSKEARCKSSSSDSSTTNRKHLSEDKMKEKESITAKKHTSSSDKNDSDSSSRGSKNGKTSMRRNVTHESTPPSTPSSSAQIPKKKPRKRKLIESGDTSQEITANIGDRLKVHYGPTQSEIYEAKVIEIDVNGTETLLRVHYTGWNTRYDEWIKPSLIVVNLTQNPNQKHDKGKKNPPSGGLSKNSKKSRNISSSPVTSKPHTRNRSGSNNTTASSTQPTTDASVQSESGSDSESDSSVQRQVKKNVDESKIVVKTEDSSQNSSDKSVTPKEKSTKQPKVIKSTPLKRLAENSQRSVKRTRLKQEDNLSPRGRDFDLNEIRSELKGLDTAKKLPKEINKAAESTTQSITEDVKVVCKQEKTPEKIADDIYEFKEPEPFEFEARKSEEKKKRLPPHPHRLFDDIPPLKLSPSSSPDKIVSQDAEKAGPKSHFETVFDKLCQSDSFLENDPKSGIKERETVSLFSDVIGDDSADRVMSEGDDSQPELFNFTPVSFNETTPVKKPYVPSFKGFTPAKNQETYSRKDVISKVRSAEPDFINSPIKGDHSSDEDPINAAIQRVNAHSMSDDSNDGDLLIKTPVTPIQSQLLPTFVSNSSEPALKDNPTIENEPSSKSKLEGLLKQKPENISNKASVIKKEQSGMKKQSDIKSIMSVIDINETTSDKNESDNEVVLPEPPPSLLVHKEGPSIAEKVLRAINATKRVASNPPDSKDSIVKLSKISKPTSPKSLPSKVQTDFNIVDFSSETETSNCSLPNIELNKIEIKIDSKKEVNVSIPDLAGKSEFFPVKCENPQLASVKKDIEERRKSIAEPTLGGKSNKVLSETIQRLSSQISQPVPALGIPEYQPDDPSESTDSDDSDSRLIIDKLSEEESQSCASLFDSSSQPLKSQMEKSNWSSTHSPHGMALEKSSITLELNAKESSSKQPEEDSNISLLLCEETIPGSPAPEILTEPVGKSSAKAKGGRNLEIPFASAPSISSDQPKELPVRKAPESLRERDAREREIVHPVRIERERECLNNNIDTVMDNTPPTTPESSEDNFFPNRDHIQHSEQDNREAKVNADDCRPSAQSKKSIELEKSNSGSNVRTSAPSSPGAGPRRGRRPRGCRLSDSEDQTNMSYSQSNRQTKYNFYVDLDPLLDGAARIALLTSRLSELRKVYHSLKAELATIDRRRKKLRRKEREAIKAAKAACS